MNVAEGRYYSAPHRKGDLKIDGGLTK